MTSSRTTAARRGTGLVAGAVLAVAALTGCSPATTTGPPPSAPTAAPEPSPGPDPDPAPTSSLAAEQSSRPEQAQQPEQIPQTALAALGTLEVKGRSASTGYDRDAFGQAWLDADRNGCDTRNDVLGEQLTDPTFKPGTRDCKVLTGTLEDPYTGAAIPFDVREGAATQPGSGVDVDHVVALSNAWVTGAAAWEVPRLAAVANDPLNLLAVDAGANRAKGAGDAATWLPPERDTWCGYVARQVAVKAKYALWVTPAESEAVRRVLERCPDEPLPADSGAPTEVSFLAGDGDRASCADLAARGLTPVRRGDAAYDPGLDGDGDGVACE